MNLEETREKFLSFCDGGKVRMDESEMELSIAFVQRCNDETLMQNLLLDLIKHKGQVNFAVFSDILGKNIKAIAVQKTKRAKIKNWKGSAYEQDYILAKYFESKIKQENDLQWLD